ncbi:PREDICTED: microfibril-associated glycoprotein 4-like isoform X2 [Acropora digitifera]|uniref:microfibril-associated glycoprotein 4-like isoform X2 n=1 Tax=Acropora digitifera TaxID=70779 RepID=UPI000779F3E6|nr:PREDICTED: microfibril-associated glycoprotein 4-like isoform X2 [Acropora digitifera]
MVNFLLSLLQVFIHSQFVMGNKLAHITLSVFYVMLWMSNDVTAGQQCKRVESSVRGKALKNHAFKSVTVGHPVECYAVCEKDPRCQSYNFFIPRKLCELNDRRKEASPQDFVTDEMRFYMGIWRPGVYRSCDAVFKSGGKISGVYKIDPDGLGHFEVYCDQTTAGGGWTVFQRRQDGSVDFYRDWDAYKRGFGNLKGEFWLGLDKIHRLTVKDTKKLRVDLEDNLGNTAFAEYSSFSVASEQAKYQLSLGTYSGTAGDSLRIHDGQAFSTKDRDYDSHSGKMCAVSFTGAWWYNACHFSNLNGRYLNGQINWQGMSWYHWKNSYLSLKKSEMKIRP